jgi:hypothetical protein
VPKLVYGLPDLSQFNTAQVSLFIPALAPPAPHFWGEKDKNQGHFPPEVGSHFRDRLPRLEESGVGEGASAMSLALNRTVLESILYFAHCACKCSKYGQTYV